MKGKIASSGCLTNLEAGVEISKKQQCHGGQLLTEQRDSAPDTHPENFKGSCRSKNDHTSLSLPLCIIHTHTLYTIFYNWWKIKGYILYLILLMKREAYII